MLASLLGALLQNGEVVVVTWRRGIFGWVFIGLIAGWLAGKIFHGRGFGCLTDILLGLVGSVLGGWIFTRLGIVHQDPFLYSLAAATLGAVILVAIAHALGAETKR